jgi:hypothetical protein
LLRGPNVSQNVSRPRAWGIVAAGKSDLGNTSHEIDAHRRRNAGRFRFGTIGCRPQRDHQCGAAAGVSSKFPLKNFTVDGYQPVAINAPI